MLKDKPTYPEGGGGTLAFLTRSYPTIAEMLLETQAYLGVETLNS